MSKSNRNQSLPSQPSQTSSTSSTTSLFDSALASVTEMASKSQDLADFAKEFVLINKNYYIFTFLFVIVI